MKRSRTLDIKKMFRNASLLKPISILAPAYNEEKTVVENIHSLMALNYPEFEIIVVNDGSKDQTLQLLKEEFELKVINRAHSSHIKTKPVRETFQSTQYPNLIVVDKENGGKADALNAGINASRYPIFTAIDTDSLLEKNVLLQMVRPFLEKPETIAVGGVVRIVNGCSVNRGNVEKIALPKQPVPLFQIVEYLRAFLFGRVGWETLNMLLVISGAFGMFKKQNVIEAGGYRTDTVGEDMELIMRLHRLMLEKKAKYHIGYIPQPVCWTEAPSSLKILSRQRNRWHRGLLESISLNRQMLFRPKYGRIGMLAFPFALIVEGLGAIIEYFGYFAFIAALSLGIVDKLFSVAFIAASILLGIIMSTAALMVEEFTYRKYPSIKMMLVLFIMGVLENFGYRQLYAWWRVKGTFDFLLGKKSWGDMTRSGFASPTKAKKDSGDS